MDLSDGILVGASLALMAWSFRRTWRAERLASEARELKSLAEAIIRYETGTAPRRAPLRPVYRATELDGRLADLVADWNTSVAVSPDGFAVITRQQGRC